MAHMLYKYVVTKIKEENTSSRNDDVNEEWLTEEEAQRFRSEGFIVVCKDKRLFTKELFF